MHELTTCRAMNFLFIQSTVFQSAKDFASHSGEIQNVVRVSRGVGT